MEYLILIVIIFSFVFGVFAPNTNSTSYKLGKGLGHKTRKLKDWIENTDS